MRSNSVDSRMSKQHPPEELKSIYLSAIKAIEDDNHTALSQILDQDDLIKLFDKDSLGSLLWKACETNAQTSISTALVCLGSNVNYACSEQSSSCLMIAAKNDDHQLLRLLIQAGAKVNATDKYGWTALFYASYFGSVECSEALLESGAHVNLTDCDKMSCLIWGSGRGHKAVVELLIKHRASVNASDSYNTSSLIWASRKGNTEIAELLLKNGALINERGMYGWTPLIVAVKGNHVETTRLLLSYRPNLNICDGEKTSPLMIACKEGYRDIAIELIKHGAFVNQPDGQGNTALIFATMAQCFDIVVALIQAGAYAEHLGKDERNAIHWSVIKNDVDSCRLFLRLGIDANFTQSSGETYLMMAAKHRSWDVIKLLLEYNAQPLSNKSNIIARNGLHVVEQSKDEQLIQVFLSKLGNCEPMMVWPNIAPN